MCEETEDLLILLLPRTGSGGLQLARDCRLQLQALVQRGRLRLQHLLHPAHQRVGGFEQSCIVLAEHRDSMRRDRPEFMATPWAVSKQSMNCQSWNWEGRGQRATQSEAGERDRERDREKERERETYLGMDFAEYGVPHTGHRWVEFDISAKDRCEGRSRPQALLTYRWRHERRGEERRGEERERGQEVRTGEKRREEQRRGERAGALGGLIFAFAEVELVVRGTDGLSAGGRPLRARPSADASSRHL